MANISTAELAAWWRDYQAKYIRPFPPALPDPLPPPPPTPPTPTPTPKKAQKQKAATTPPTPTSEQPGPLDITFDWIGAAWNASFATNPLWAACLRQAILKPAFRGKVGTYEFENDAAAETTDSEDQDTKTGRPSARSRLITALSKVLKALRNIQKAEKVDGEGATALSGLLNACLVPASELLERHGAVPSDSCVGSFFAATHTQCESGAAQVASAETKFQNVRDEAKRASAFLELDELFAQTMTATSDGLTAQQVMFNLWWFGEATVSSRLYEAARQLRDWLKANEEKDCVAVVKCFSGILNDTKRSLDALREAECFHPAEKDPKTGDGSNEDLSHLPGFLQLPQFLQHADKALESIQHARIRIANRPIPGWEEPGQSKSSSDLICWARKEPVPIDPRWTVLSK